MKQLSVGLLIVFIFSIISCSVLQQASEMKTFGKCEFRIGSAGNMNLAGVDIQEKSSLADLTLVDMSRIGGAIAGGTLPFIFDLNIQAKNPNKDLAAMNKLDWILIIDDIEMARGVLNRRVEIPGNSISSFPVSINLDLMKSLSGESGNALINFALNLAGTGGEPTRIKLRAKPTIYIGANPVEYPGYITIREKFGAE